MRRPGAAMDQVHQRGAQVHEPFINPWLFNRGPTTLIERSEGVSNGSNRGRQHEDGRYGLIPPKEVAALGSPRRCHGARLR
jgi:hypothetical protein